MVTMDQIKRGIGRYVDEEIAPKLTGVKRYGVQVYTGLALQSAEKAMEEIMQHPAIRMLGLMDDNHRFDIDRLHMIALD